MLSAKQNLQTILEGGVAFASIPRYYVASLPMLQAKLYDGFEAPEASFPWYDLICGFIKGIHQSEQEKCGRNPSHGNCPQKGYPPPWTSTEKLFGEKKFGEWRDT